MRKLKPCRLCGQVPSLSDGKIVCRCGIEMDTENFWHGSNGNIARLSWEDAINEMVRVWNRRPVLAFKIIRAYWAIRRRLQKIKRRVGEPARRRAEEKRYVDDLERFRLFVLGFNLRFGNGTKPHAGGADQCTADRPNSSTNCST